ncbi:cytochrome P450 [Stigmatella sp. ncwal1]|uniref:Cytochrome P450 n=1 Tax=Stigmatella ashevillensis TaxID=2995309 RepID=A0ABT5DKN5_9BACT|nr:cytochrome P450 [Stigmatella ashevillena]MDC0713328.1 cytochrome P450 [Stigmatella ashevillena]
MSTPDLPHELWSPEVIENPFPLYARMRQAAPVARSRHPSMEGPIWVVCRYHAAVEFLKDNRFAKSKQKLDRDSQRRYFRVSSLKHLDQHMLSADPPMHTRLRSLVAQAFTSRRVEALRPRITAIAEQLLDTVQKQDSVDLLDAFAFPLPITVIAELLGVPVEDQDRFRAWTTTFLTPPKDGDLAPLRRMAQEFQDYLQEFLARRRAEPRDDLASAMITAEEQGDRLTPVELMSMVFLLLVAGHETTVNLIGNGLWALLKHPGQLERLRAEPALLDSAVEEMLRYCGPVKHSTSRFTLEDTEFHGERIPAGEMVVAGLVSANHDAEVFPEPERFDIARQPNRHIAFGSGIHFCLGAPLALLEAKLSFRLLLERLPRLRFAVEPSTLRWRDSLLIHGLERLPVTF